jgi:hypothetical protein
MITLVEVPVGLNGQIEIFAFPLNPGLADILLIAANKAKYYDLYEPDYVTFYWVPRVTEYSCGAGQVVFMADYDALDPPPTDARHLLNNDPHSEGMPHMKVVLSCDCEAMLRGAKDESKFVRTSSWDWQGDLREYDGGTVYFAYMGIPTSLDGATLGEIHCNYRYRLRKQNVNQIQGLEQTDPRNYSGLMVTSNMNNGGVEFPDVDAPAWGGADWLISYWMWDTDSQSCTAAQIHPFQPDGDPQAALGNIVIAPNGFRLPPGIYLFTLDGTLVANNPDPDPGNVDAFRIRLTRTGSPLETYPQWEHTVISTHEASAENTFTCFGVNFSMTRILIAGDYFLEYQLSTRADEGAETYANMTIVKLQ